MTNQSSHKTVQSSHKAAANAGQTNVASHPRPSRPQSASPPNKPRVERPIGARERTATLFAFPPLAAAAKCPPNALAKRSVKTVTAAPGRRKPTQTRIGWIAETTPWPLHPEDSRGEDHAGHTLAPKRILALAPCTTDCHDRPVSKDVLRGARVPSPPAATAPSEATELKLRKYQPQHVRDN